MTVSCYTVKGKPDLPLALVLTDAAFNYLFDLWVIHFIKAGWLYTLQKRNGKILLWWVLEVSLKPFPT